MHTLPGPGSENPGGPGRGGRPSFLSIDTHPLSPVPPTQHAAQQAQLAYLVSILFSQSGPASLPPLSVLTHLLSPGRSHLVPLCLSQSHPTPGARAQSFSAAPILAVQMDPPDPGLPTWLWAASVRTSVAPQGLQGMEGRVFPLQPST